jgi:error-prone DNA polymerase
VKNKKLKSDLGAILVRYVGHATRLGHWVQQKERMICARLHAYVKGSVPFRRKVCGDRAAGLVLVRQRPGSAKGVMFITLEDETGIGNLVVWPQVFEKFRRVVMSASMIAVRGRIQREGEVIHLVAQRLVDLSAELATVGSRDAAFPLPHGRGDQVTHAGGGPDSRELPPKGLRTRDIYVPDLLIDILKTKSRNFH